MKLACAPAGHGDRATTTRAPGARSVRFVRNYAPCSLDVDATSRRCPARGATAALDRPTLPRDDARDRRAPDRALAIGRRPVGDPAGARCDRRDRGALRVSRVAGAGRAPGSVPANLPAQVTRPHPARLAGMSAMTESLTTSTPQPNPVTARETLLRAILPSSLRRPRRRLSSWRDARPGRGSICHGVRQISWRRFRGTSWVEVWDRPATSCCR